ncbi:MAG: T9SS type A sorting domain-containing protein, partial [Saprospiraceae bacterium]
LSNPDLRLVPNPATTQVEIWTENLGEKGGELTVFDAQGRVVWQRIVEADSSQRLDTSMFSPGLYRVCLRTEQGVVTKALVIIRF